LKEEPSTQVGFAEPNQTKESANFTFNFSYHLKGLQSVFVTVVCLNKLKTSHVEKFAHSPVPKVITCQTTETIVPEELSQFQFFATSSQVKKFQTNQSTVTASQVTFVT
jgi:hypothetical protein